MSIIIFIRIKTLIIIIKYLYYINFIIELYNKSSQFIKMGSFIIKFIKKSFH